MEEEINLVVILTVHSIAVQLYEETIVTDTVYLKGYVTPTLKMDDRMDSCLEKALLLQTRQV